VAYSATYAYVHGEAICGEKREHETYRKLHGRELVPIHTYNYERHLIAVVAIDVKRAFDALNCHMYVSGTSISTERLSPRCRHIREEGRAEANAFYQVFYQIQVANT